MSDLTRTAIGLTLVAVWALSILTGLYLLGAR